MIIDAPENNLQKDEYSCAKTDLPEMKHKAPFKREIVTRLAAKRQDITSKVLLNT